MVVRWRRLLLSCLMRMVKGIVSELSRAAQEMESIRVRVEKGSHLEEGDGAHGQREIRLEEVDGFDDFILSRGSGGPLKRPVALLHSVALRSPRTRV